jgi:hypothetical protein
MKYCLYLTGLCCGIVQKVINQNYIHEEIKSRLSSWNAWYRAFQNLFFLSSRVLSSENVNIKIFGTIIVPVVSDGCETGCRTLREGRILRHLRIECSNLGGMKGQEAGEN